jgi:hypothetical protein
VAGCANNGNPMTLWRKINEQSCALRRKRVLRDDVFQSFFRSHGEWFNKSVSFDIYRSMLENKGLEGLCLGNDLYCLCALFATSAMGEVVKIQSNGRAQALQLAPRVGDLYLAAIVAEFALHLGRN